MTLVRRAARASTSANQLGFVALLALAAGIVALPGTAAARPVDCELTVNGRSYAEGRCEFSSLGDDGSFMMHGSGGIFVYVNMIRPGLAELSWNEVPASTHAHARLGEARRNGGCWSNQRVRVCAWTLGQGPSRQR